jgi:hypothetical protein
MRKLLLPRLCHKLLADREERKIPNREQKMYECLKKFMSKLW